VYGTIEVRRAHSALKAMKGGGVALVVAIIVTYIVMKLFGPLSMWVSGSVIGGAFLFIIIVILASISYLMEAPISIELEPSGVRFLFWRGLKVPLEFRREDIVEFDPSGHIRDKNGQSLPLLFLEKEELDRLKNHLGLEETRPKERPEEAMSIKCRSPRTFLIYTLLFLGTLSMVAIQVKGAAGYPIWFNASILGLLIVIAVASAGAAASAAGERELTVDGDGIRLKRRGKVRFNYRWEEVKVVGTWWGRYSRGIKVVGPTKKHLVSTDLFPLEDLKRIFELMKSYAKYYGIEVDNGLGW